MPSRIIKESIVTSDSLGNVSAEAERLFWRLVVKADDFGLFYGSPKILASLCFPLDPPKEQKVASWLDELSAEGILALYESEEDGKQYLKLLSWDKHQQKRASKSKFPQPKSIAINCNQVIANVPVNENENENVNEKRETRNVNGNENTPPSPPRGARVGVRGSEKASAPRTVCDNDRQQDAGFEAFWAAYPRKASKKDAAKAWKQLKPNEATTAEIMAGVERWRAAEQWTRDGGQYIPYPATFLRGERWADDCPPARSRASPAEIDYDDEDDFIALMRKAAKEQGGE